MSVREHILGGLFCRPPATMFFCHTRRSVHVEREREREMREGGGGKGGGVRERYGGRERGEGEGGGGMRGGGREREMVGGRGGEERDCEREHRWKSIVAVQPVLGSRV